MPKGIPNKKPKEKIPKKMGRPTKYNQALADRICELVATHPVGLTRLCDMFPEIPTKETINAWRWEKDDFSCQYTKAKQFQAELMAESFEDVVQELQVHRFTDKDGASRIDSGMVQESRLLIDTRKWTASKLAPKIYGDAKRTEELSAENALIKSELADLRHKLAEKSQKEY